MRIIISLIIIWIGITSCSKGITDTNVFVKSQIVIAGTTDTLANPNVIGYLFIGDTAFFAFKSYEDAFNGKVFNEITNATEDAIAKGMYDPVSLSIVFNDIEERLCIGVVCDTVEKIYYYRNLQTAENLANLYLTLVMRPEKLYDSGVDENSPWVGRN